MNTPHPPCLLAAWGQHERDLRRYLRHRLGQAHEADELAQEVFLKVLSQGRRFCAVEDARAWLFQVARNALIDQLRTRQDGFPLPADIPAPAPEERPPVEDLSRCLPRVLMALSETDRLAITLCDLEGHPQQALADRLGISLPGAKSRLQRARIRLRKRLVEDCQVRFDARGRVCCFVPRS